MADYGSIFEAAGKQYNVDPRLLAAVMTPESNGNPNAVSPRGAAGLMQLMPTTATEMGVTDIKDPQQNIFGGAKYLSQQLDKYGSVPLALAAYNAGPGAVDKAGGIPDFPETQAYVKKVTAAYQNQGVLQGQNMPQTQMAGLPPTGADAASGADPFSALMAKAGAASVAPDQVERRYLGGNSQGTSQAPTDPFSALMAKAGATSGVTPGTQLPTPTPRDVQPYDLLGAAVEPLATMATGAIAAPIAGLVRLGSVALGNSYAGAEQAGNNVSNALTYHPMSQGGQEALTGLGNMLTGAKNAVMDSAIGRNLLAPIGQAYTDTFVKGAPNALMATINDQVPTVAANIAAIPVAKALGSVVPNRLTGAIGAGPVPESWPMGINSRVPEAAAPKPHFTANGDGTFTQAPPRAALPGNGGIPPGAATSASPTPVPTFDAPDLPTPKTVLSGASQADNIATMKAIGLNSQRPSAIAGDKFLAGQEYQHSKLDSAVGEAMRQQLANEQAALKNYGQSIIKNTGAAADTPEAVGQSIRAPLQGLSDHYDNAISQLYQAADQRAGGIPNVQPDTFGKLLDTNSMFAGKAENSALRRGINAYTREQGIVGQDGSMQPITVQQAEGLRQYLNSQWSPQNSGLIGKIKEALDTDVTKSGGDDIYASARALHAERKNTLDNPKGISSLLNESGPNGINQAVPDEKVASKIMSMPTGQLGHIVDTLNNLPDSLAPQGQQALAEMKGALAKQIYQAGDSGGTQNGPSLWNAANVTKQLNAQASRMSLLFSPDEIAQFQTLNNAGHILQTPSAYPGAAVQGHNLLQRGMIYAPPTIGSSLGGTIGHALGGVPGMMAGSSAGGGLGAMMSGRVARAVDIASANKLKSIMANPQIITGKK
ncbi:Membrane-bound lytic murein transglycosylase F [Pandoraea eparura]|uniref:Membrane-bound lytic murein transglycosylase F n=1 Tax=Pandoraea eparura TaxID=2508291 RepID=A0A5E4X5W8_9BURK|nr:transglycosylase SLT domain-containing protein [Pandoraea eparura]VVE31734.1 Membrane-bound lytic murein transglycosylase F [Pandoraea eparura]